MTGEEKVRRNWKHTSRVSMNSVSLVLIVLLAIQASTSLVAADDTTTSLRSTPSQQERPQVYIRRRMEDAAWNNYNDETQNYYPDDDTVKNYAQSSENTFIDMFVTPPKSWSPLEWGIFAGIMTLFGVFFCCWCLVCVIPQCCGHRNVSLAYAACAP